MVDPSIIRNESIFRFDRTCFEIEDFNTFVEKPTVMQVTNVEIQTNKDSRVLVP